jgi:hypothetical protein
MAQQNSPDAKQKQKGPAPIVAPVSKFEEYLYVNLIFWGFLVLLCIAVYIDCAVSGVIKFGDAPDEVMSQVFKFILLVFGLGFTAVSVFDALYDKFAGSEEPEETEPAK